MKLQDIKSVFVHWSESMLINRELNPEDNEDIDKEVDPVKFNELIKEAAASVGPGYDKTCLTVKFTNRGDCTKVKFYLTNEKDSLLKLLSI